VRSAHEWLVCRAQGAVQRQGEWATASLPELWTWKGRQVDVALAGHDAGDYFLMTGSLCRRHVLVPASNPVCQAHIDASEHHPAVRLDDWTAATPEGIGSEDMIYTMTDAVAAARARKRGLTITEQHERTAAADAALAVGKKTNKKSKGCGGRYVVAEAANGTCAKLARGRVRANAAQVTVAGQAGLAALVDRQRSLMAAGKHRRTRLMVAVAPAGTADLT